MIRLIIDNQEVLTPNGFSIPYKKRNSITNDIGDFSLNFNITNDLKGINSKLLGFTDRPANFIKTLVKKDIRIDLDFMSFISILSVTSADNENFKCNLYSRKGDFNSQVKDKLMTELSLGIKNLGADSDAAIDYLTANVDKTQDDLDFACFTVHNESFFDGSSFETTYKTSYNNINYWHTPGGGTIPLGFLKRESEPFNIFPYLGFVLRKLYEEHGYAVTKNPFKYETDLKNLTIYNTYNQCKIEETVDFLHSGMIYNLTNANPCVLTTLEPVGHGLTNGWHIRIQNCAGMTQVNNRLFKVNVIDAYTCELDGIDSSAYGGYYTGSGDYVRVRLDRNLNPDIDYDKCMPNISIKSFINAIRDKFGCQFLLNNKNRSVRIVHFKDIYNSKKYIDINNITGKKIIVARNYINGYKLYDTPDGNDTYYAEKVKELLTNYNVKSSVATKNDLPLTGNINNDVRFVVSENSYYLFSYNLIDSGPKWIFYSYDLISKYGDNNDNPFKMNNEASTVVTAKESLQHVYEASAKFLLPCAEQVGQDPELEDFLKNEFSLRLLFYRGMQDFNSPPETYPMGTNSRYDFNGNVITGANIELKFDGDYGLYENFLKEFIYFNENEFEAQTDTHWDERTLFELEDDDKLMLDGITYLYDAIDFNITQDGVEIKSTKLLSI